METNVRQRVEHTVGPGLAVALCVSVAVAGVVGQLVGSRLDYAEGFGPYWLPLAAGGLAATAILLRERAPWLRIQRALLWASLLLMVWAANGLPLDLLRVVGLIPLGVDWPGLATRALALGGVVVLARLVLTRQANSGPVRATTWFGVAAFVLALAYPFFRTLWVLGGTLGLMRPGAAGEGFAAWLACTPWLLAAALSLLLVWTPRWMPRRLLLVAGWCATAAVVMIGPAAIWTAFTKTIAGDTGLDGIATWVPFVFYGSWFLWGIAGGAATRAYQVRTRQIPSVQDIPISLRSYGMPEGQREPAQAPNKFQYPNER